MQGFATDRSLTKGKYVNVSGYFRLAFSENRTICPVYDSPIRLFEPKSLHYKGLSYFSVIQISGMQNAKQKIAERGRIFMNLITQPRN
jgi:hypothetical protein